MDRNPDVDDLANCFDEEYTDGNDVFPLVEIIMEANGLEKHIDKFHHPNLTIDTFLNLNESDLIAIGITDATERGTIIKNLMSHKRNPEKYNIKNNPKEELIIANNILNQIALLQKYAALIEYTWREKKYLDLEKNKKHSQGKCLRTIARSAVTQTQKIVQQMNESLTNNGFIKEILQVTEPKLQKHILQRLKYSHRYRSKNNKIPGILLIGAIFITTTFTLFKFVSDELLISPPPYHDRTSTTY